MNHVTLELLELLGEAYLNDKFDEDLNFIDDELAEDEDLDSEELDPLDTRDRFEDCED